MLISQMGIQTYFYISRKIKFSKVHEQNLDPNLEENDYLKSKILALEA
jgi:hypothetical protein